MKKIIIAFIACLVFSNLVFASPPLNQLIFFGDSLTDNGNLYKLFLKKVPKSPPYFEGRFSNGPTWAEEIGSYYQQQYQIPYKIYAFGGATVISHKPTTNFIAPATLTLELNTYLLNSLLSDKSNVLYGFWIGGNDYLFDERVEENLLTSQVVDKLANVITTLINKGGRNFLILNMPDLARIPASQNNPLNNRLHSLSVMHNQKLAAAIQKLEKMYPNVKIVTIDIYTLFNNVMDHTAESNEKYKTQITNTTTACWGGGLMINHLVHKASVADLQDTFNTSEESGDLSLSSAANFINNSPSVAMAYRVGKLYEQGITPCDNDYQYLFWDQIHPSSVVHQILAKVVIDSISQKIH